MLLPGIRCLPTCILPGLSIFLVFDSFSLISITFLDGHYQMFSQSQCRIFYVERFEFHSTVCSMMFVRIKICPVVPSLNPRHACSSQSCLSTSSEHSFSDDFTQNICCCLPGRFKRQIICSNSENPLKILKKYSSQVHFISNEGSILYQRRDNNILNFQWLHLVLFAEPNFWLMKDICSREKNVNLILMLCLVLLSRSNLFRQTNNLI